MKAKSIILFLVSVGVVFIESCNQSDKVTQDNKDTTYLDSNGKSYKFLGQIPDSLRTTQQNAHIKKLLQIRRQYTKVENNQFFLDLTEEEAISKGLSSYDYHILTQEVEGSNKWVKERGLNADSLNKAMIKEIDNALLVP
ncbi:MAG: hypothetical protein EOO89_22080 [Pedobacter sp.]|nr:MAG: hypothetical protein EOO89_22080 [Pedobacter sp.]